MSVLQFPSSIHPGKKRNIQYELRISTVLSKKVNKIPESCCSVTQLGMSKRSLFAPVCRYNISDFDDDIVTQGKRDELGWLDTFSQSLQPESCQPWSKYHASKHRTKLDVPGINTILPLLRAPVHTIDTQYHCMNIIKNTIGRLNPSQTPVDTCDQPVYALTKQLQWRCQLEFESYFSMFAGMHIKQSMQDVHADIIRGSGLPEVLKISSLSITGTDAVININHLKRVRYCIQVIVCVIYKKMKEAYFKTKSILSLMQWLNEQSEKSSMSFTWVLIFNVEILILLFVRSQRESNFLLRTAVIRSFMKYYSELDHYNYARWLSVHLFDCKALPFTAPDVFQAF